MKNKLLVLLTLPVAILFIGNFALACSCGCKGNNCGANVSQQSNTNNVAEEKVECPVMKNWILPSQAADKTEYNGKTYYFCCGGCKEKFLADPEKYIKS